MQSERQHRKIDFHGLFAGYRHKYSDRGLEGGRPDRRKTSIPTVATSKTPRMKIRKARPRAIYMALRIFISGDKFPTGGNRRYIQTISGYSRVTAQL